jgi:hypothetical protein
MTGLLKHRAKRVLTAMTLAAAISTLGPAASSFYAFSSDFRPKISLSGGTSVVYKSGALPDWMADTKAGTPVNRSVFACETHRGFDSAPI